MLSGPPDTIRKARRLRKAMSLPEVLLWQQLRRRPAGLKFRRQHPAGLYILDFFCADATLGIEVDGGSHSNAQVALADAGRDLFLRENGVEVVRLPAAYVLGDIASAVAHIVAVSSARRAPSTALCAVPLPVPGRI